MWLSILLNILSIVPTIAAGIEKIHAEKDVATKTQMAQDALSLAVTGAAAVLPPSEAQLSTAIGSIASATMASTVAALHAQANPPAVAETVNAATGTVTA